MKDTTAKQLLILRRSHILPIRPDQKKHPIVSSSFLHHLEIFGNLKQRKGTSFNIFMYHYQACQVYPITLSPNVHQHNSTGLSEAEWCVDWDHPKE
jgi:hypothetical protein